MVSCVACGLSHNARKIGITFHRFPKKPELYEAWVQFVNKPSTSIPKFGVLCSQHFEESEFDKSAFKVLLKPNAVPSKVIKRRKYDKISSDELTPSVRLYLVQHQLVPNLWMYTRKFCSHLTIQ